MFEENLQVYGYVYIFFNLKKIYIFLILFSLTKFPTLFWDIFCWLVGQQPGACFSLRKILEILNYMVRSL